MQKLYVSFYKSDRLLCGTGVWVVVEEELQVDQTYIHTNRQSKAGQQQRSSKSTTANKRKRHKKNAVCYCVVCVVSACVRWIE